MSSRIYESSNIISKNFSRMILPFDKIKLKLLEYQGGKVICEKNDETGLATICINRPEKRNAFSGKMCVDLKNIVDNLEEWENGKGILIYGANDMFCAGGDLNMVKCDMTPEFGYEWCWFMQETLHKLSNLPLISVAFIDGFGARGGGAEIVTFCDYRLFSSSPATTLGFVHNKMGIVPAWGSTTKLIQLIGRSKTLDLLLSAEFLTGAKAMQMGLVDDVVDTRENAIDWILNKVKCDKSVIRATKKIVAQCSTIDANTFEMERSILSTVWAGPQNKIAVDAFHKAQKS